MLKIVRALWFLSVVAVLANLLYIYAGLPEQVLVQDGPDGRFMADREMLFYSVMVAIILLNALVYVIKSLFVSQEDFRGWFHGLMITINIFFIVAMSTIGLLNSAERYDFSRTAYFIYGSVILIMVWAMVWPLYLAYRKIFIKS